MNMLIAWKEIQTGFREDRGRLVGNWHGGSVLLQRFGVKDREELKEFAREVRNKQKIRHPNIALMMGFCIEKESGYIVEEYVKGESLSDFSKKKTLSKESLWEIAASLASVFGYLEKKNLKDLDINEKNIVVDEKGKVKVFLSSSKGKSKDFMENYKLLLKNLLKPKKNGSHESLNELLHRVESKALATNDQLLRFFSEKT